MSRRIAAVLGLVAAVLAFAGLACAQGKVLTILHVNDTHSALFPIDPASSGGISRVTRLIQGARARHRNVLALHAGDAFVGGFEFNKYLGYPELKIMEGYYDAMALGNHEFDLGLDALAGVLAGALGDSGPIALPILCANFDASGTPLAGIVRTRLVKMAGAVKVGITAVVNRDQQSYSPAVFARLTDPYEAAGREAAALAAEGCEFVICLSHLGLLADRLGLSQVPGIDIIVGGHSHDALQRPLKVNGKIIVQAGEFGKLLGELSVRREGTVVKVVESGLKWVTPLVADNPALTERLAVLREGIVQDPRFGAVFTEKVAYAPETIKKTWPLNGARRDTGVGNLVADAMLAGVQGAGMPATIALEASGYTASPIYNGKVTGNDILRAIPYGYDPASGLGFKVHSMLLAGAQLLAGLEYSVSLVEYTNDLCLQPSGLTFAYDSSKPAAPLGSLSRIDAASVMIGGVPVDPNAVYWVVVNEQLYNMLVSLGMTPFGHVETGLLEYNLVKDYVAAKGTVRSVSQGRVVDRKYLASGSK